jgi:hypothetical protein
MHQRLTELELAHLTQRPTLKSLSFDLPIKTVSEANQRDHWRVKSERRQAQQLATKVIFQNELRGRKVVLPCVVKLTRVSCKLMDGDNCQGSLKHVRDQIARIIGVDDGDPRIKFEYGQERVKERFHNIKVEISSSAHNTLPVTQNGS